MELTHLDETGRPRMVDVGAKEESRRAARATGFIRLHPETVALIGANGIKKGNVILISELAGVQAAKQTATLIPLCHNLFITAIDVKAVLESDGVSVSAEARCVGQTGVEMEALTAVSIALLTVYDMCKAVDKTMSIESVRLLEKTKIPAIQPKG